MATVCRFLGGQPFTSWLFAKGRAAGFNIFRFFALGDNNDDRFSPTRFNYALQPQPGTLLPVLLLHAAATAAAAAAAAAAALAHT